MVNAIVSRSRAGPDQVGIRECFLGLIGLEATSLSADWYRRQAAMLLTRRYNELPDPVSGTADKTRESQLWSTGAAPWPQSMRLRRTHRIRPTSPSRSPRHPPQEPSEVWDSSSRRSWRPRAAIPVRSGAPRPNTRCPSVVHLGMNEPFAFPTCGSFRRTRQSSALPRRLCRSTSLTCC